VYVARDPRQLLAVSAPGRDEIVNAVCSIGPCSIAELARFLGRSRNGLYYHVRALRDCRILLEDYRSRGTQKTATYDVPGRPFSVYYDLRTAGSRKAVLRLATSRLRAATRAFSRACRPDVAVVEGIHRNLWATDWKGWLSNSELEQVNRAFLRIVDLFQRARGRSDASRKYYMLTYALSPAVPQPSSSGRVRRHRSRHGKLSKT
jgi:hypothetical protein